MDSREATIKKILILAFMLMAGQVARAATYYVDYASGSNSNAGTKVAPWKSSPGMQTGAGCAGALHAYTHAAGDRFIFKGGVTWPLACFLMTISNSGTSGNPDYYGVDKTWFTGGSFTRPIFDMANGTPTGGQGNILRISGAWVVVDNLELKRNLIIAYTADCADATIDASGGGNVTVQNSYIHDWTITAFGASSGTGSSTGHGTGSICQNATSNVNAIGNTMTDLSTTASVPFGACFHNLAVAENNDCEHTGEGEVGHGQIDGNTFANINGIAVQVAEGNGPYINHTNIIENTVNAGSVYNNVLHDNAAGVSILECNQANIYNNVIWNNANDWAISVDTNCSGATSSTVANVYNNTVDCSTNTACFGYIYRAGGTPGILNLRNNQWISNSPSVCYGNAPTCSNTTGGTQSNNVTMSTATAAAQGYTAGNKYAPTSGSGGTVGTGANLTSLCSGLLGSLCLDASGAPWKGGSFVARPTGSTAWNAGAYQFQAGGGPPSLSIVTPSAGTISGSVNLTSTCTPQGTATCSSVQYSIDGYPFGSAATSSPYTVAWNTATAANAIHAITATATDSNGLTGSAGLVSVTVNNSIPGCFVSTDNGTSSLAWTANQGFTAQTANFTATVVIEPWTANQDTVFAISQAAVTAYSQAAVLLRANASGVWDVYNGTGYAADNSAPYSAGTAYTFTISPNFTGPNAGKYTIAETSPSSIALATNYLFRSTAPITSLGFINSIANNTTPDTQKVCNFQVGASTSLTFSPVSLNFGNVTVGGNTTLTNTATSSGGNTTYSSVAVAGNADFSLQSQNCTASPNASCAPVVKFAPTATGLETATLTYTDSATGSPQSVPITGTGIPAASSATPAPTSLNFGNVQLHSSSTSGPIVVTLMNGPVTFTGTPITFDNPDFSVGSNTCTGSVSLPSCQITLQFTPSSLSNEMGTMTLHDDAPTGGSTQTVSLIGTGVNNPTPAPAVMFVYTLPIQHTLPLVMNGVSVGTFADNFTCKLTCIPKAGVIPPWSCSCQ